MSVGQPRQREEVCKARSGESKEEGGGNDEGRVRRGVERWREYLVSYGKAVSGWDAVGWSLCQEMVEKLRGGQSKKKKRTGGNTGEKEVERSRGASSSETEVLGLLVGQVQKEFASQVGQSREVGEGA